ncbi:MAG TPA: hypothetical protein VFJ52_12575 [Terriglobia bacterium]|nr:hypothetical protein [Terriglobia bacterium]
MDKQMVGPRFEVSKNISAGVISFSFFCLLRRWVDEENVRQRNGHTVFVIHDHEQSAGLIRAAVPLVWDRVSGVCALRLRMGGESNEYAEVGEQAEQEKTYGVTEKPPFPLIPVLAHANLHRPAFHCRSVC